MEILFNDVFYSFLCTSFCTYYNNELQIFSMFFDTLLVKTWKSKCQPWTHLNRCFAKRNNFRHVSTTEQHVLEYTGKYFNMLWFFGLLMNSFLFIKNKVKSVLWHINFLLFLDTQIEKEHLVIFLLKNITTFYERNVSNFERNCIFSIHISAQNYRC